MNKRPVTYLQTDKRWKSLPYQVKGETATIGGSGCGPTAAAMAIETITGQTFTPVDACRWSVAHGYKAKGQGTYYGYFRPQMAAFSIECRQLLGSRLNRQPGHKIHDQVKQYLNDGYYVIALMGPGTWTSGGHFVLLWAWDDKVRINDPASTKAARLNGDPATFRKEARNYWLIDARDYNKEEEIVTYEQWKAYMDRYRAELGGQPVPDWGAAELERAKELGVTDGSRPMDLATRCEVASMILRAKD